MATETELERFETKPCPLCGRSTVLELDPVKVKRWQDGEFVQTVWPEASNDERELIVSGTHAACWDEMFPEEVG